MTYKVAAKIFVIIWKNKKSEKDEFKNTRVTAT